MRLYGILLLLMVGLLIFEYADAGRKKHYDEEERGVNKRKDHEYRKYERSYSEPDDTSEEFEIIAYKPKDARKKTLGDVIKEKKQKKQAKKQKFEKNVLRHFKTDDDTEEAESSEEKIVAPLRKVKLDLDCNSAEEDCQ